MANEQDAARTLSVTVDPRGRMLYVRAVGEVDMDTADLLEAGLHDALARSGATVVVDLAEVRFLDAAGLRALVRARINAEQRGRLLTVANPQPLVRGVLEITGILGRLSSPTLGNPEP